MSGAHDDQIDGYASALFEIARVEGNLAEVEDELFRFRQVYESNDELRDTLTDPGIPPARRQAIVEELLGPRASKTTTSMVSFVVAAGRIRQLPAIIDRLVERAAAENKKSVAEVRSAVALTDDQKTRLAGALAHATGKDVEVKVIIDHSVLGGIVAKIGDTIIDGSVRRRLGQLRDAF